MFDAGQVDAHHWPAPAGAPEHHRQGHSAKESSINVLAIQLARTARNFTTPSMFTVLMISVCDTTNAHCLFEQ
jgi:hypothetical protein